MRRIPILVTILLLLLLFGAASSGLGHGALAQSSGTATPTATPENIFSIASIIGKPVPRKALYNAKHERLLILDAYNQLIISDALTYQQITTLPYDGFVVDVLFSHDENTLAVLTNVSVDLWDIPSNTLIQSLTELNNPFTLYGPLSFSRDDAFLMFFGEYPTPRELRREETDRSTYPWLWDIAAARGERDSQLTNGAEAVQLYDFLGGATLAPSDSGTLLIGALPGRVQVLDAATLEPLFEIPLARYARDPFQLLNSQIDGRVYIGDNYSGDYLLIQPQTQSVIDITTNTQANSRFVGLDVESISPMGAPLIGPERSNLQNTLHARFLGENYRSRENGYGNDSLTLRLVDLILPPGGGDITRALIYLENHTERNARLFLLDGDAQQMLLSPDFQDLLVRDNYEDIVRRYALATGDNTLTFTPALRLNRYSRTEKNRILAYSADGGVVATDFQRITTDGATTILAQDLTYSRSYDRFFFAPDSQRVITMAGTEWRSWSVSTGEVLQREVISAPGSIVATAANGTRMLYQEYLNDGRIRMHVVDVQPDGLHTESITINSLPYHAIERVLPNPDWTRFLVIYNVNSFGPYAPGNQLAMYTLHIGLNWVIAGDDLPSASGRDYAWLDEQTAIVMGSYERGDIPSRIYGIEYAPNGLPACLMERFDDADGTLSDLWEFLVWKHDHDYLNRISQLLCDAPPANLAEAIATLSPTHTPARIEPTAVGAADVPACFAAVFNETDTEAYLARWQELIVGLTLEQQNELAIRLCEGLKSGGGGYYSRSGNRGPRFVMFIDAVTGVRAAGDYQPPQTPYNLMEPFYELFRRIYKREMGLGILSPDKQFIAASGLPGELVVYRLTKPFEAVMANVTATAQARYNAANQIVGMPTASATYDVIGTARPTLTPTAAQTQIPPPLTQTAVYDALVEQNFCPARLTSISSLAPDWGATGRLLARIQGDVVWAIEPENGSRYEAPEAPLCGEGVQCSFSPDREWILADTYDFTYVIRPDGSAERILFDQRTPEPENRRPNDLRWATGNTLNWTVYGEYQRDGKTLYGSLLRRDVLNVFPDPELIPLENHTVKRIPTQNLSIQPGGVWALVTVPYNTGYSTEYKNYLYNMLTMEARLFAQNASPYWHPFGDRVFWSRVINNNTTYYYQMAAPDWTPEFLSVNLRPEGLWSNDGEQMLVSSTRNNYDVAIWTPRTGQLNRYCLPETDWQSSPHDWTWSPDGEYVAVQVDLPKDRNTEGVGNHTLIIELSTGDVIDLTNGAADLVAWVREPGQYPDDVRVTLTPSPTMTPSPTPTPAP